MYFMFWLPYFHCPIHVFICVLFVCSKMKKSDPVMIMLYGVLPYDEHYGYKYKVDLFAISIVNFLLLTHNDR